MKKIPPVKGQKPSPRSYFHFLKISSIIFFANGLFDFSNNFELMDIESRIPLELAGDFWS